MVGRLLASCSEFRTGASTSLCTRCCSTRDTRISMEIAAMHIGHQASHQGIRKGRSLVDEACSVNRLRSYLLPALAVMFLDQGVAVASCCQSRDVQFRLCQRNEPSGMSLHFERCWTCLFVGYWRASHLFTVINTTRSSHNFLDAASGSRPAV